MFHKLTLLIDIFNVYLNCLFAIAEKLEIDRKTVRKYWRMSEEQFHVELSRDQQERHDVTDMGGDDRVLAAKLYEIPLCLQMDDQQAHGSPACDTIVEKRSLGLV
ncbi:hypothetical protein ES705_28474 [subsurface metagenome]